MDSNLQGNESETSYGGGRRADLLQCDIARDGIANQLPRGDEMKEKTRLSS